MLGRSYSCRIILALPLGLLCLFGGNAPVQPEVNVAGTWDAYFSGTVKGQRTPHDDTIVMELKQNGSIVKGTLRFKGLDVSFPVAGKVEGRTFTYSSKSSVGPNCDATVVGEVSVDEAANRFQGSQTQSNCEGTAEGKITAVRR
jgi:hypothetical protein